MVYFGFIILLKSKVPVPEVVQTKLVIVGKENGVDVKSLINGSEFVTYHPSTLDVEKYTKNCSETASILLGRTTVEGWLCGKAGWIYDVDASGQIKGKTLYEVPEDIDKFRADNVAKEIRSAISKFKIIITKSTVPVTTGDEIEKIISHKVSKKLFSVVSNPEFLREGEAIRDFIYPDRVVIGANDKKSAKILKNLYSPLISKGAKFISTNRRAAELIKYAANAMLATRISFMNELANLAEIVGADIEMVRQGIGSDPRIGYHFLYPGCGYGGSCFPKDVKALIKTAKDVAGFDLKLLKAVEEVNDLQKFVLPKKVKKQFGEDLKGKHFALWGLAFKPNTDDMREASSRVLINELIKAGASITAYDPVAMDEGKRIFKDEKHLTFADTQDEALKNADALIIVTEWTEFRSPDFALIKSSLKSPMIFDGRNLYDPKAVRALGFNYYPIGR